jgi:hypothetical protein
MQETVDEDGNILESNIPVYGDPIEIKANVSADEGRAFRESTSVEMFGIDVFYDKVITIEGVGHPFNEATVFYINKSPYSDGDIDEAFDYRATRIAESLNSTVVAVKRVDMT